MGKQLFDLNPIFLKIFQFKEVEEKRMLNEEDVLGDENKTSTESIYLNENYEVMGYDTTNFILNTEIMISLFVLQLFLLLIVPLFLIKKSKSTW